MTGQWVAAGTARHWHSSITQLVTLLQSVLLQRFPHTLFSSTAGPVDKCMSSNCLAQLFCNTVFNYLNQVQCRPARSINLSSKFFSLAGCSAWFPPQRLGFPSSYHCGRPYGFVGGSVCIFFQIKAYYLVCLFMYTCSEFSNQIICLNSGECATCWHPLHLPMITHFLSPSSNMVSAVAPILLLSPCLSLFHHFIINASASLDVRLPCLLLRAFQRGRAPKSFIPKIFTLHSQMEGYTLEMPRGLSLVRLFRRNLQMLKSVSGMWELKGSS